MDNIVSKTKKQVLAVHASNIPTASVMYIRKGKATQTFLAFVSGDSTGVSGELCWLRSPPSAVAVSQGLDALCTLII